MQILDAPFRSIDWSAVPATTHRGETGSATWRTIELGNVRVRMVEYSAAYRADHWCERGHVVHVLDGELRTELTDGSSHRLAAGDSYVVADGVAPHRSSSPTGARLLIVD